MIHPVESYWLHWGPAEQTAMVRNNMDANFENLTKWLLFGGIDFDFISESLLPDLCKHANAPLQVGAMEYDVILVPNCETLRKTTLDCLESFREAGGRLIFTGDVPTLEDARPSDRGATLATHSEYVPFNQGSLLEALASVRLVEIRNEKGTLTENLLYNMRQDGEGRWLFLAHGTEPYNKDISRYQDLRIRLAGKWNVTIYNTMNGEIEAIKQNIRTDTTEVYCRMYDYDSLLLWLEPVVGPVAGKEDTCCCEYRKDGENIRFDVTVSYTLSEPNALLLDQAEYALDDGEWKPLEEILKLENVLEADIPFGKRTNLEWMYLLGEFGVETLGRSARIVAPRKALAFGNIASQGLPFYGGNITCHVPIETKGGRVTFRSNRYRGVMQAVRVDGGDEIPVIFPPYTVDLGVLEAGKHTINVILYGHRRNSFGPVHLTDLNVRWIGPNAWRSEGEEWSYDYIICEEGILNTPVFTENGRNFSQNKVSEQ